MTPCIVVRTSVRASNILKGLRLGDAVPVADDGESESLVTLYIWAEAYLNLRRVIPGGGAMNP
jgi:hypothetical protein